MTRIPTGVAEDKETKLLVNMLCHKLLKKEISFKMCTSYLYPMLVARAIRLIRK